ncbi:MAG: flagellar hook-length control protein FliK, partial [Rhodocyclaceae bacterium]|nr:flagellar hook-length control protein FliK [Rhodocyclaceae bacterium]
GEVQDAGAEEAAADAEAVAMPGEAGEGEGAQNTAQQGEGDEAQDTSGQEALAAMAAVPVQEGEIIVPQDDAAVDAAAAEKIAVLADAPAQVVELPVAQAAVVAQSETARDLSAPILVPGVLEDEAQGALSEQAELTLNLALQDGQAKGKGAQAGQAALLAQKGAQTQAAALANAQQAAHAANAKGATQSGDSFAAALAAKGVASNAAAGANAVSTVASATGASATGAGTAANSAAQAQHLNALTGSVPGQTSANGARVATVQQLPVYTPAGQKGWADEMSVRLSWLAQRGESKAELVLSPPNMGKLGVSLHMNGDQMTAQFVTASAATRDMLEQAMPRLRELLQQANIELAQADVSTGDNPQQLFRGHAGEGEDSGAGHSRRSLSGGQAAGGDMTSTIATNTASSLAALMGDGAIDIFA